ncbi:MAG: hypothetical protein RID42_13390 [Alphaproteobacteria bacterium]
MVLRRGIFALTLTALAFAPLTVVRAQDALKITGFVEGTTSVSIQNNTTFIDWDYDQPLENALLAILDVFTNAAAGYEFVLVNLDVTEEQAFEFDLLYGGQVLEFQGNSAMLSRATSVQGSQTQGPRALQIKAPPKRQNSQQATVSLQLLVRAP